MTDTGKNDIRDAVILFLAQMCSFAIIALNYRAIAQAQYLWSILTDLFVATISYFVVKKIAKSKDSIWQWIGFAIGSAVGTVIGIFISVIILGK